MTPYRQECLALSLIKGINAQVTRRILEILGDIHEFFQIDLRAVSRMVEVNDSFLHVLNGREAALAKAAEELRFAERHNIRVLGLVDDETYPSRLSQCEDAPVCLFVLGDADLDNERLLAVVGTRRCSAYGQAYTAKIIEEVRDCAGETTIVSGLAYGIDKAAHDTALRLDMPTVAVLAHGLGMVYPAQHKGLAKEILRKGGALVSEYLHDVRPFRGNFLERNRIIAGLCDAVFVAESPLRGGALNTAAHARGYDREVLALPGRASDEISAGCNKLIGRQLALLATTGKDVAEGAGWEIISARHAGQDKSQHSIFDIYTGCTKSVYEYLKSQPAPVSIDNIVSHTGLGTRDVMSAIGELDLDGLLTRHPGARLSLS